MKQQQKGYTVTNLAKKPPLGQKTKTQMKNEKYLQSIREMPCCVCQRFGENQLSNTTAHHPIHDRHGSLKRPDSSAIPLCEGHHQGLWDQTKIAIHKKPELWRETYGPDWSYSSGSVQDTDI